MRGCTRQRRLRLTWQSLSGFENAGVATFEPLGDARCRTVVNMTYAVPLTLKPLESTRWVKRLIASVMRGAMEAFQAALEADGEMGRQEQEQEQEEDSEQGPAGESAGRRG